MADGGRGNKRNKPSPLERVNWEANYDSLSPPIPEKAEAEAPRCVSCRSETLDCACAVKDVSQIPF